MPPQPGGRKPSPGRPRRAQLRERCLPRPSRVARSATRARCGERDRHRAAAGVGGASAADGLAVRLTGYLGHTLGLGAAARGYVEALGAAGVPVSTVSVPLHHLALPVALEDGYGRHGFEDLVHARRATASRSSRSTPTSCPSFVERLGEDYFEGPRIGIWGWETNSIPPRWQRAFALVAGDLGLLAASWPQNIGAVAPVPVVALPPPVQRPPSRPRRCASGVPDGFLFLFVFDYLSTVQRKNPVGLIEAFKRAFAPARARSC